MKQLIKVPAAGESVTQAVIGEWQKQDGETVYQNDILVIMETDKASMDLIAEHSGQLKILKTAGEEVKIGEVIGEIDTSVALGAKQTDTEPALSSPKISSQVSQNVKDSLKQEEMTEDLYLAPSVRRIVAEKNIDPLNIQGTGPSGRITKADALSYPASVGNKLASHPMAVKESQATYRKEKMTTIRKRIAQRLVESQQSTATLTTFNEIDMSRVIAMRSEYKEEFQRKHGVKLGFMSFFIKAIIQAIKKFPRVNAYIDEDDIVYSKSCHIGVAVSTERGLLVPVIRQAETLSVADLEKIVLAYAEKARDGKITPDELMGGSFTISNGGVFGSLLSTPILNPPQSGILGLHKIEQRPVVVDNKICIRPMMYAALSYDHRLVDGRESVGFLIAIKECIEDPVRLWIDL